VALATNTPDVYKDPELVAVRAERLPLALTINRFVEERFPFVSNNTRKPPVEIVPPLGDPAIAINPVFSEATE
jgi:hypothetical protein